MSTVHLAPGSRVFYAPQRPIPQVIVPRPPLPTMATPPAAFVGQRRDINDLAGRLRDRFHSWMAIANLPPQGVEYWGTYWNGEPDSGFGTWRFPDGRVACGWWQNRALVNGRVKGENCDLLFFQEMISGTGTWCFYQTETFTGTWEHGRFCFGTILSPDGMLVIEEGRPKEGVGKWLQEGKTMKGSWTHHVFVGHISCLRGTDWYGSFDNQPWDGVGTWVDRDGNQQKGLWHNGVNSPA